MIFAEIAKWCKINAVKHSRMRISSQKYSHINGSCVMPRKGENIFKRKDGRWEARYIHHYENGVAKYRYVYGATYMEAKRKRVEDQRKFEVKKKESESVCCNFETLSAEWLKSIEHTVKESTYARYARIVSRYLCPKLSDNPNILLTATTINELVTHFLTEGGYRGKPLSPKTTSDIICVFNLIAKYGNKKGLCHIDIANIKHPKSGKKPIKIFDHSSLKSLEKILLSFNEPLCLGILFALFSGVRIGELCGIRWEDINLQLQTVTIKRTIERIANTDESAQSKTKIIVNTPKTENSYRIIPLQKFLVDVLKENKKPDDCYLLTGTTKYTEPHQYYIRYKRFLKRNNLGEYTFHCLRHTFATRCVEAGFDMKSLSEILGHSSVTTTMAIYIHPTLEQKRTQMEKIIPVDFL